jgi:putative transposase
MYPTKQQKETLKQWMGTYRYVYNQICNHIKSQSEPLKVVNNTKELTVRFINEFEPDSEMITCQGIDDDGNPCKKTHRASKLGCPNHRPKDLPKNQLDVNPNIPTWTMETPKDIRKEAIFEIRTAYKSALSNLKSGNIDRFQIGFKTKKKNYPITIPKTAIRFNDKNNLVIYPSYKLDEIKISKRQKKKDLTKIDKECKIQYKDNKWYILIPHEPEPKIVIPERTVCALDPGARCFQTLYSPEGVIKFQHNRELLNRLHKRLDHLQSLRSKKWIRSNNYKRIRQKIYCRIGWIIDQIHYSTINELKHYNHILLPTFESQELVSKNRLRSKTNRELMSLQHYTFKQRLKSSLYFQKDTKLYIVSETYTSKTCTRCGVLNDVGSNEIYHCKECGLVIDRDINGARNILLKNICSI